MHHGHLIEIIYLISRYLYIFSWRLLTSLIAAVICDSYGAKVVLVGIAMFTFFWAETGSSDCYQSSFANGSFRSSKSFKTWIIQKSLIFS